MEEKKTLKERFEEASERAKWKVQDAVDWCNRNKELIVVLAPIAAGTIVELIKIGTKRHTVNEEKRLKERYVYDRSNGHYYELKRQPKSSEWIQIEHRKDSGESLGDILNDMRLLR